jgi:hypothetical protein
MCLDRVLKDGEVRLNKRASWHLIEGSQCAGVQLGGPFLKASGAQGLALWALDCSSSSSTPSPENSAAQRTHWGTGSSGGSACYGRCAEGRAGGSQEWCDVGGCTCSSKQWAPSCPCSSLEGQGGLGLHYCGCLGSPAPLPGFGPPPYHPAALRVMVGAGRGGGFHLQDSDHLSAQGQGEVSRAGPLCAACGQSTDLSAAPGSS